MNVQKLAIAIGLLKNQKCSGPTTHTEHCKCQPSQRMPIVEIDGIKNLDSRIEFYQDGKGLSFEATANFKYDDEDNHGERIYFTAKCNKDGINKDDILEFSQKLLDELPRLQLGLNGMLLIRDNEFVSLRAAFEDVFTTIESETLKVQKTGTCSVCYEKTDTTTPCDHPLCNRCWSKIEMNDETNCIPCPLCRENIFYL